MAEVYDVFLSYNTQDRAAVQPIAEALKGLGLQVWLDEWELQPGKPWMGEAEAALAQSRAMAFFVGHNGIGPWQEREVRVVLERQVYQSVPVIPVRLPDADENTALPPFLRQNTWVVFRVAHDPEALARLYWGITGRRLEAAPRAREDTPEPPPDPHGVDDAIARLAAFLRSGTVTYYIGGGLSCGGMGLRPRPCDITRELLLNLGIIDPQYHQLLPPIDVAGLYYSLKHGPGGLEDKLAELVLHPAANVPDALPALGELLLLLAKRPQRRIRRRVPQLIVTTNLDVMIERALLRAGVAFTRLVQRKSCTAIEINHYDRVQRSADGSLQVGSASGSPVPVPPGDTGALDEAIASVGCAQAAQRSAGPADGAGPPGVAVEELTEPILYKFSGSLDVADSCAISTEQYLDFLWRVQSQRVIPARITDIVANTPALFIGYSVLDPDFRLIYHALLREAFQMPGDVDLRYALQMRPAADQDDAYRQVETKMWGNLKSMALQQLRISIIEEPSERFLRSLRDRFARELEVQP